MQYSVIEGISFGILDGVNSILKINENFNEIFVVGGGSRSKFWIELLSSILNKNIKVTDQSEYSAAMGVARLAMYADKNIEDKESIIKPIQVNNEFLPNKEKISILTKRYEIWKDLYSENKKIAPKLLN